MQSFQFGFSSYAKSFSRSEVCKTFSSTGSKSVSVAVYQVRSNSMRVAKKFRRCRFRSQALDSRSFTNRARNQPGVVVQQTPTPTRFLSGCDGYLYAACVFETRWTGRAASAGNPGIEIHAVSLWPLRWPTQRRLGLRNRKGRRPGWLSGGQPSPEGLGGRGKKRAPEARHSSKHVFWIVSDSCLLEHRNKFLLEGSFFVMFALITDVILHGFNLGCTHGE